LEVAVEKLYIVELLDEQRWLLREIISAGTWRARLVNRAHILLMAEDGATDAAIATALHVSRSTVARTRRRYVEDGLEAAMNERPRCGGPRKFDGKHEAMVIALACSTPPEGQKTWTLQLLADKLVELQVVDTISDESVRRILKKTSSSPGCARNGVFPQ
jgi:putative transposase